MPRNNLYYFHFLKDISQERKELAQDSKDLQHQRVLTSKAKCSWLNPLKLWVPCPQNKEKPLLSQNLPIRTWPEQTTCLKSWTLKRKTASIWVAMLKTARNSRKKKRMRGQRVTRLTNSSSRRQSRPNRRQKRKRTICSETTRRVKRRTTMTTTSTMTLRRICQRPSMRTKTQTPTKRAQIQTVPAKESLLVSRLGLTLAWTR